MGLHSITGQKLPIQMLSRLGHSVDYNTVCEIETAQAEIALKNVEVNPLKLRPATEKILLFLQGSGQIISMQKSTVIIKLSILPT